MSVVSLWQLETLAPYLVEERRQGAADAHRLREARRAAFQPQPGAPRRRVLQWFPAARCGAELLGDLLGRNEQSGRRQVSPRPAAA